MNMIKNVKLRPYLTWEKIVFGLNTYPIKP